MSISLLHLTGLRIGRSANDALARAELIAEAALSAVDKVEEVHVVVSGNVVESGLQTEFQMAVEFFAELRKAILRKSGVAPRFFVVSGKHDCDFSGDQSLRNVLINGVRSSTDAISASVATELATVLANFQQFEDTVCEDVQRISPWLSIARTHGSTPIQYVLLNSSVLSQRNEEMGRLFVPVPTQAIEGFEGRTVYVMHHSYSWLLPDNACELAQHASVAGDLFLMGQEHEIFTRQVRGLYDDASITYVLGKGLRESETKGGFQSILIDLERGMLPRLFTWSGASYQLDESSSASEYVPWPARSGIEKLAFSSDGYKVLSSAGANFSHRRKANITLQDVFVWPELKTDKREKGGATAVSERSDRSGETLVSEWEQLAPVVVIKGSEQSGKTALAKSLALNLSKRNIYPVLLEASIVSSWREKSLNERLDGAIDLFYGRTNRNRYRQLDASNKVLIIDDFDIGQVTSGYFEGLRELRKHFGRIILMLDAYPGAELALTEFLRDENFVDSDVFELLPSTYHHRLQLIEQWLTIGGGGGNSADDLRVTAAKLSKVVDETLGRNLVPAVPLFVLIVLQQAELAQDLDTVVKSGSHGFLYESLITRAISTKVVVANVITSLAYLTAFADELMKSGDDWMDEQTFADFHGRHCERFALVIPISAFRAQMEQAEILDCRNGGTRFRYPFHTYYFQAKALASIEDWGVLAPKVDELIASIHTERSANMLLFLAHVRRNPRIGEKLLAKAKTMFVGFPEADLFSENPAIGKFGMPAIRQILFEGSRDLQVEEFEGDEVRADEAGRELTIVAERRLKARLDDALAMNGAFKTLQVLGQILRNHSGETEREEKLEFTRTCVGLGFRVLGFLFEMVAAHGDEMLDFRALQLRQELPRADAMELAEELQRYLPGLVSSITVGTIIKIANAIGSEDLEIVLDEALSSDPTRQLLRLVTQLEHFSDFPRTRILDFEREVLAVGQILPYSVLRRFVIRRFYLFPVREELKRSVCDRFKIPILPFSFLEQKPISGSR